MAELFKWPPQFHEDWNNTEEFKTIVSKFENHVTQRRSKWSRRYGNWKFVFSKEVATNSADDIMDFYVARKGMANFFYLPSWKKEFQLLNGYIAGDPTLTLYNVPSIISARLTSTTGQRGNLIHISSDDAEGSTGDVFQITNITNNVLTVTRLTGSNSNYVANTFVNICYGAYFSNDILMQENIMQTLYRSGLEFTEK